MSKPIFPLDYVFRPNEITNCIYASNDTACPYMCVCDNPDLNKNACENGYITAGNCPSRKDDPNPLIHQCINGVPANFSKDDQMKASWMVGCFSGVKGRHKLFDPTKIDDKSCEEARKKMGWGDNNPSPNPAAAASSSSSSSGKK